MSPCAVWKRKSFINRLNASNFYQGERAHPGTRKWVQYLETREIRASGDRGATGNWKIPRPQRQGNEVRNEISSFDESEDGIALETQMTGFRVLFTNLRIAPRDQIAESAEIETLNR